MTEKFLCKTSTHAVKYVAAISQNKVNKFFKIDIRLKYFTLIAQAKLAKFHKSISCKSQ
jgi:hypothetical protein